MAPKITDSKIRFWRMVDKTNNCWIWTGIRSGRGYGLFHIDATFIGRKKFGSVMAHRYSYSLKYGYIGKNLICHKCDNKLCVRPSHLFKGTPKMNSLDMCRKGRQIGGPNQPHIPSCDRHHNLPLKFRFIGKKRRFKSE